jgi:hypothetical protein
MSDATAMDVSDPVGVALLLAVKLDDSLILKPGGPAVVTSH